MTKAERRKRESGNAHSQHAADCVQAAVDAVFTPAFLELSSQVCHPAIGSAQALGQTLGLDYSRVPSNRRAVALPLVQIRAL